MTEQTLSHHSSMRLEAEPIRGEFTTLAATTNANPVPLRAHPAAAPEAWLIWDRAEGLID